MKAAEWASAFTYEPAQPRAEWLAPRTSYSNRKIIESALHAVGQEWDGWSSGRLQLPEGEWPAHNAIQAVLGDYPAYPPTILHQGG